jgi:hypothetical protein
MKRYTDQDLAHNIRYAYDLSRESNGKQYYKMLREILSHDLPDDIRVALDRRQIVKAHGLAIARLIRNTRITVPALDSEC